MTVRCNAGTTFTKMKGTYGAFQVWLNKKGIANLISIPMPEASGYIVSTHTHKDWVVTDPDVKDITFKRDKGVYTGMPYISLRDQNEGLVMIETVRKNMECYLPYFFRLFQPLLDPPYGHRDLCRAFQCIPPCHA